MFQKIHTGFTWKTSHPTRSMRITISLKKNNNVSQTWPTNETDFFSTSSYYTVTIVYSSDQVRIIRSDQKFTVYKKKTIIIKINKYNFSLRNNNN